MSKLPLVLVCAYKDKKLPMIIWNIIMEYEGIYWRIWHEKITKSFTCQCGMYLSKTLQTGRAYPVPKNAKVWHNWDYKEIQGINGRRAVQYLRNRMKPYKGTIVLLKKYCKYRFGKMFEIHHSLDHRPFNLTKISEYRN